jgi:hypothetical protein
MATEPVSDEGVPPTRKPRKWGRILAPLSVAVYLFAVWYFGWEKVRAALLGADPVLIVEAGLITVAAKLGRIAKWRVALGPNAHAVGLYFMSRVTGVWSPGRVGEFLPLLWRRHRTPRLGGWILLDRVMEIVAALTLGVVGLGFTHFVSRPMYVGIVVLTAAVCVMAIACLVQHRWLRAIAHRLPAGTKRRVVAETIAETSAEIDAMRGMVPALIAMTVASKVGDLFQVVLIFRALGTSVSFMLVAAAKCALAIVSYLPITPVASGVPHAVQGWMMNQEAGVLPETVVASVGIEAALMTVIFSLGVLVAIVPIRRAAL